MKIYTRTGDNGTTSLFGGKRVFKCDAVVDVYGSIDELNSWMGYIKSKIKHQKSKIFIGVIQGDLFHIGSVLAGWKGALSGVRERVGQMENMIDQMEHTLPTLHTFILPGGGETGAAIHIARSVCRRVERNAVAFQYQISNIKYQKHRSNIKNIQIIIMYLNRLSDFLFVLARFMNNQENEHEVVWTGNVEK